MMSGLCMALDDPDLVINMPRRLDEVILVIGNTSQRAIIQHESLRIGVKLLALWWCFLISIRPRGGHDRNGVAVVAWSLFAYAAMPNTSVDTSLVTASDFDVADHFLKCCFTPTHCFEERLDPQALGVGSVRLSFIVSSSFSELRKRMAGEELSLFTANLNVKVVPERFVHSVRLTNELIVVSIICVL